MAVTLVRRKKETVPKEQKTFQKRLKTSEVSVLNNDNIVKIETLDKEDPFYLYKTCVNDFTYLIGVIHRFYKEREAGNALNMEYFQSISKSLAIAKDNLLTIKERLGLEGGLCFLENSKFDGFEINNGVFLGDRTNVLSITTPWMEFQPDNCYLYEVAHYIQYLAFWDELYCGNEEFETENIQSTLSLWERIKGGIEKCRKKFLSSLSA